MTSEVSTPDYEYISQSSAPDIEETSKSNHIMPVEITSVEIDGAEQSCINRNILFPVNSGSIHTINVAATATYDEILKYVWSEIKYVGTGSTSTDINAFSSTFTTERITELFVCSCQVYNSAGFDTVYIWFYVENHLAADFEDQSAEEYIINHYEKSISYETKIGDDITLSINATADNQEGLRYIWYKNPENEYSEQVDEVTGPFLTVNNVTSPIQYLCKVEDTYGNFKLLHFHVNVNNSFEARIAGYSDWYDPDGSTCNINLDASYGNEFSFYIETKGINTENVIYSWMWGGPEGDNGIASAYGPIEMNSGDLRTTEPQFNTGVLKDDTRYLLMVTDEYGHNIFFNITVNIR